MELKRGKTGEKVRHEGQLHEVVKSDADMHAGSAPKLSGDEPEAVAAEAAAATPAVEKSVKPKKSTKPAKVDE